MQNRPVVTVSTPQQTLMYFTTLWNLVLWSMLYREGYETGSVIKAIIMGLLIEFFDKHRLFNFRSAPLIDEIKQSHRPYTAQGNKEKPFECAITYQLENKISENINDSELPLSKVKLSWTIGEGHIEKHLKSIFRLFDSLNEYKISSPIKPSKYNFIKKCVPYTPLIYDMPTKARYFELFIFPGYLAGKSLGALLNLNPAVRFIFIASYTAVSWGLNVLDSYYLKDIMNQYKLEGFAYYYKAFWSCPPTCLGKQLTKQLEFRPSNSHLKNNINLLFQGEKILIGLKQDSDFLKKIDDKRGKMLGEFRPIICRL
jgi:hypothetical protein